MGKAIVTRRDSGRKISRYMGNRKIKFAKKQIRTRARACHTQYHGTCLSVQTGKEGKSMSYHVTKKEEAVTYCPDLHYDMRATRLHNAADVDGKVTVGLSHFLPGGGAKMSESPAELLYYIVEGEMTVTTDDGKEHVLHEGDSIHFSPMQGRESKNTGCVTAKMLVIIGPTK